MVGEVGRADRVRFQLSLFVPPEAAMAIEAVRRVVDPVQHRLIPAHVTLCREDEIEGFDTERRRERLASAPAKVRLGFGAPLCFREHGILLPCVAGEDGFQRLRAHMLGGANLRDQDRTSPCLIPGTGRRRATASKQCHLWPMSSISNSLPPP